MLRPMKLRTTERHTSWVTLFASTSSASAATPRASQVAVDMLLGEFNTQLISAKTRMATVGGIGSGRTDHPQHPDMLVPDITKAAEWTVEESDKRGPHFVRWWPRPEDVPRNAISLSAQFPPAAVLSGDPPLPRKENQPVE